MKNYFLIVALALLSTATVYAQSDRSEQPQKQSGTGQQHANTHNGKTAHAASESDADVNTSPNNSPPENCGHEEKENTTINRNIMLATWVIAFVAFFQLIAIGVQAYILKRTVDATEKAANAADRTANAIVRIEVPIIRTLPQDLVRTEKLVGDWESYGGGINNDSPTRYSVVHRITFANYGRTPAFPEMFSAGWLVAIKLPDIPTYNKSSILGNSIVIEPNETFQSDIHYSIELNDEELETTKEGRSWLWFYGCLFYRDFMNEKREARFCWRFTNQRAKEMKPFYIFSSDGDPPKAYTKNT